MVLHLVLEQYRTCFGNSKIFGQVDLLLVICVVWIVIKSHNLHNKHILKIKINYYLYSTLFIYLFIYFPLSESKKKNFGYFEFIDLHNFFDFIQVETIRDLQTLAALRFLWSRRYNFDTTRSCPHNFPFLLSRWSRVFSTLFDWIFCKFTFCNCCRLASYAVRYMYMYIYM